MSQARFPESDFGDFYSVAQVGPCHTRLLFGEDSFPGSVLERYEQPNVSRDGNYESKSPLVVTDCRTQWSLFSVNTTRVTPALSPRPIEMRPNLDILIAGSDSGKNASSRTVPLNELAVRRQRTCHNRGDSGLHHDTHCKSAPDSASHGRDGGGGGRPIEAGPWARCPCISGR